MLQCSGWCAFQRRAAQAALGAGADQPSANDSSATAALRAALVAEHGFYVRLLEVLWDLKQRSELAEQDIDEL